MEATHLHIIPFTKKPYTTQTLEHKRFQSEPHSFTHTHIHTAQTGAGARGSAAGFPGSLTGLMEALCLKPGQTTADSRGDAYQLLAMLRPEGERGRDRNNGEREGERESWRKRGDYNTRCWMKKKNCQQQHRNKKQPLIEDGNIKSTSAWILKDCMRLRQLTGNKHFLCAMDARYWHQRFTAMVKWLR